MVEIESTPQMVAKVYATIERKRPQLSGDVWAGP